MDEWVKQRIWFTTRSTVQDRYSPKRRQRAYPADQGWEDLFAKEAKQIEERKRGEPAAS